MSDFSKAMPKIAKKIPEFVGKNVYQGTKKALDTALHKTIDWGRSTIVGMFRSKPRHA